MHPFGTKAFYVMWCSTGRYDVTGSHLLGTRHPASCSAVSIPNHPSRNALSLIADLCYN